MKSAAIADVGNEVEQQQDEETKKQSSSQAESKDQGDMKKYQLLFKIQSSVSAPFSFYILAFQ